MLQSAGKFLTRKLRFHFETDRLPLLLEEWLGIFESQRRNQLCVIAEAGMQIKREMGAVKGQVVGESALKHPSPPARNWSQPGPEQAVVNDEKIYPPLHRRADRPGGSIDRRAKPGHCT